MASSAQIAIRLEGPGLDAANLASRYADWLTRIATMHQDARALTNPEPAFHLSSRPLSAARVALVTTAGAYLEGDPPFDVVDPHGDSSFRLIPDASAPGQLRFSHSHYDTSRAAEDPNVVLPLEPLHALVARGVVGAAAPRHIGMMGFNPDPRRLVAESVPAVVDALQQDDVDIVVLSPG